MATVEFESSSGRFDIYITCRRLKPASCRYFWMFAVMPMNEKCGYTVYSVLTQDLDDSTDRRLPPRIDKRQVLDDADLVLSMDVIVKRIHSSHPFFTLIRGCHHENRSFIMNILTQLHETCKIPDVVLMSWYSEWYRKSEPPSGGPSVANLDAAASAAGLSRASSRMAGPATADSDTTTSSGSSSERFSCTGRPPSASVSATDPFTVNASRPARVDDPPAEISLANIDVSAEVLGLAGLRATDRPWLQQMRAKYTTMGVRPENIWVSATSFRITGFPLPEGADSATKLSESDNPVLKNFRDRLTALGIPIEDVSVSESVGSPSVMALLPGDTSARDISESIDPIFDAVRAAMSELKMPAEEFSISEVVTTGIPGGALDSPPARSLSFFSGGSPRPVHGSVSDASSWSAASPRSSLASTESPPTANPCFAGASSFNPNPPSTARHKSASTLFPPTAANPWLKRRTRPYSPVAALKAAGPLGKVLYVPEGQTAASMSAAYCRQVSSPASDQVTGSGRGSSAGGGSKGGRKSKGGPGLKGGPGSKADPVRDSPAAPSATAGWESAPDPTAGPAPSAQPRAYSEIKRLLREIQDDNLVLPASFSGPSSRSAHPTPTSAPARPPDSSATPSAPAKARPPNPSATPSAPAKAHPARSLFPTEEDRIKNPMLQHPSVIALLSPIQSEGPGSSNRSVPSSVSGNSCQSLSSCSFRSRDSSSSISSSSRSSHSSDPSFLRSRNRRDFPTLDDFSSSNSSFSSARGSPAPRPGASTVWSDHDHDHDREHEERASVASSESSVSSAQVARQRSGGEGAGPAVRTRERESGERRGRSPTRRWR